jgi:hypothetical protein
MAAVGIKPAYVFDGKPPKMKEARVSSTCSFASSHPPVAISGWMTRSVAQKLHTDSDRSPRYQQLDQRKDRREQAQFDQDEARLNEVSSGLVVI